MSKSSLLTAGQISLSLSEIELLKFQFDDRRRNDDGLFLLFGYHVILLPNEKKANVGVQISVSNPEIEDASPACEMMVHFEFTLKHKKNDRALIELIDNETYKDLRNELASFYISIVHSTVRGMWFMATRGTLYHEGFDIHLPIPSLDRVNLEVR